MSRISELIKKKCPNGVEQKKLEEVCNFQNGFAFKSNLFKADGKLLLRITNITNNKIDLSDVKYVHPDDYKENLENYIVQEDDIVIAMSGATTGKIGINHTGKNLYLNQRVGKITPKNNLLNNHFLYHYLLTKVNYFYKLAGGGAQPNLSSEMIKKTTIPIPPIEVQEEIVRILDKFSELEAELEAELEVRKKEYQYWLGKLIDRNENLHTIGELFEFKNGINKSKECFGTGNQIINYTDVYKNNKITKAMVKGLVEINTNDLEKYSCNRGDVFFTRTSETREEVGFASVLINDMDNSVFSGFLLRARPITELLIPEYCAYCFSSPKIRRNIISSANFTTRATITGPILSRIKIYVPNKTEQKKIVNILDKFDKLINNISEGIPAEIEARHKQYEYYRNKLLNFKELKNE